jgi:deoxyhypusine monooxygenase
LPVAVALLESAIAVDFIDCHLNCVRNSAHFRPIRLLCSLQIKLSPSKLSSNHNTMTAAENEMPNNQNASVVDANESSDLQSNQQTKHQLVAQQDQQNNATTASTSDDDDEAEYFFEIPPIEALTQTIVDQNAPIAKRMRTVFLLKQLHTPEARIALSSALRDPSVLLSHEAAYALGQMGDKESIPILSEILCDLTVDPIVRHECAEALAAIGDGKQSLELLRRLCDDPHIEVAETCRIAVSALEWSENNTHVNTSKYASVDPAPPQKDLYQFTIPQLQSQLLDTNLSLFMRYRAMFTLRDLDSEESVAALCAGFADKSALFKHEIAYVFGQMQHEAATRALSERLADVNEHAMVRHEAAEALGSIATEECNQILKQHVNDSDCIVRQSCEVALDLVDYWNSEEVCTAVDQDQQHKDEQQAQQSIQQLKA